MGVCILRMATALHLRNRARSFATNCATDCQKHMHAATVECFQDHPCIQLLPKGTHHRSTFAVATLRRTFYSLSLTNSLNFVIYIYPIEHGFVYILVRFLRLRLLAAAILSHWHCIDFKQKRPTFKNSYVIAHMLVARGSIQTYYN